MSSVNWDKPRAPSLDAVSLYVASDTPRGDTVGSFENHLQNPPPPVSSNPPAPARAPERADHEKNRKTESSTPAATPPQNTSSNQPDASRPVAAAPETAAEASQPESTTEASPAGEPESASVEDPNAEISTDVDGTAGTAKPARRSARMRTSTGKAKPVTDKDHADSPEGLAKVAPKKTRSLKKADSESVDRAESPVEQRSTDPKLVLDQPEVVEDGAVEVAADELEQEDPAAIADVPVETIQPELAIVNPAVIEPTQPTNVLTEVARNSSKINKTRQRGENEIAAVDPLAASPQQQPPEAIVETQIPAEIKELIAVADPNLTNNSNPNTTTAPTGTSPQQRFVQHLAAKGAEKPSKGPALTEAEQTRLVERVARAFRSAESRDGKVTLRLHPPELGVLRVELQIREGTLSARMEAETPSARTILLENVHMLRDRLAEQGVTIERFDVELLDRRPQGDAPGFEQSGHRQTEQQTSTRSSRGRETSAEPEPIRSTSRPAAGQLNVIV